jgi:hypothetical protein
MLVAVRPPSRAGASARLAVMLVVSVLFAIATLAVAITAAWIAFGVSHS